MRGRSRLDDDFDENDPHYRMKQRHGTVVLDRLTKLIHAGYRIDLRMIHEGLGIPLKHPSKRAPDIYLWGDGHINDHHPRRETPDYARNLYEPEDTRGFDMFVASIPKPNDWQKFVRMPLKEVWELILALAFLALLWWGMSKLLEGGWHWINGVFS